MDITKQVIERASGMVGVMLQNYNSKINTAYLEADDELGVALKVTFKPSGSGVQVKVDLNFVAERVKDSAVETVEDGRQMQLTLIHEPVLVPVGVGRRCRARWYQHR